MAGQQQGEHMKKTMIWLLMGLATAGFAADKAEVEQLLGVSSNEGGITFQVESNGCTFKKDFLFDVEEKLQELSPFLPALEHNYYITVKRTKIDSCSASVPYGTQMFMSFNDLGIHFGKFHVTNPVGGQKLVNH